MNDANTNDLLARLATLESAVARLTSTGEMPDGSRSSAEAVMPQADATRPGRRDLLRVGSLAVGAAAIGLVPRSAEAANGDPLRIGQVNGGTLQTRLEAPAANDVALHVHNASTTAPAGEIWGQTGSSGNEAAGVGRQAFAAAGFNAGVCGSSSSSSGHGVFAESIAQSGQTFALRAVCESPEGFA